MGVGVPHRPRRMAVLTIAVPLALGIAFVLGRSSAAESNGTGAEPPGPRSPQSHHTSVGAVRAYLSHQEQLADPHLWTADPRPRMNVLRGILASSSLRRSVERSITEIVGRRDALGRALRFHRPVLARSASLGYRVLSHTPRRTALEVWTVSVVGGKGLPLDLRLMHYRAVERWTDGSWRLARTREVGEGSAVRFRGAPALSARLAASLRGFRRLSLEP
jgi:hypothetical protein